jgi:hypothetical protein
MHLFSGYTEILQRTLVHAMEEHEHGLASPPMPICVPHLSGRKECWRPLRNSPMEESPMVWAAWHRHHHNTADKERNPHSPLTSVLWCHVKDVNGNRA